MFDYDAFDMERAEEEQENQVFTEARIYRETEKALLIEDPFGRYWVAKSVVIEHQDGGDLVVPHWVDRKYVTLRCKPGDKLIIGQGKLTLERPAPGEEAPF